MKNETEQFDFFRIKELVAARQNNRFFNVKKASSYHVKEGELDVLINEFENEMCSFYSLRFISTNKLVKRKIILKGCYDIEASNAGGWLLKSKNGSDPFFWVPKLPTLRKLDEHGHILTERELQIEALNVSDDALSIVLKHDENYVLDMILIELDPSSDTLVKELSYFKNIEKEPVFLWGSHSTYSKPADFFIHYVHGHIYENRTSWPFFQRICSENDAHSLFVTLNGLALNTGKELYEILKSLLVLSVISRQSDDGAWRHGEWTKNNESHFRLHTSALHLLRDYWFETQDESVLPNLKKGIDYLIKNSSKVKGNLWFLHDELETSTNKLKESPFKWQPTENLEKSKSNMLVLNTHLDTTIAIACYAKWTGDDSYETFINSANQATAFVLLSKRFSMLYKFIDSVVFLTLLPEEKARELPIYLRMIKRFGWKYLSPNLYKVKAVFPRMVMPNGFVERALTIKGIADEYLSVNTMDLVRLIRWENRPEYKEIIDNAISLEQKASLRVKWLENKNQKYSLGFYAETMYQLCYLFDDWRYRKLLAETLILMLKNKLGIIPSILGGNREIMNSAISCLPYEFFNEQIIITRISLNNDETLILNGSSERMKIFEYQDHNNFEEHFSGLKSYSHDNKEIPLSVDMEIGAGDWVILKRIQA